MASRMPVLSNDWAVYQFFNTPYDPVSAAYWSEPQPAPQREEPTRQPKMNTVEIKCLMCCEGCKKSVKRALGNMMGVSSFKVSTESSKVTVCGEALRAEDVLKVIQKASKKKTELWPEKRFFVDKRSATAANSRLD